MSNFLKACVAVGTMICGLLWLFLASSRVMAAPAVVQTPQVTARLLTDVGAVHSGDEIWVGVELKMIPHWHTYWRNPGDSGTSTTITWQLPEGAHAGDIQWPTPSRSSLGPVTNYSYEDEVILPSRITLPDSLVPGSQIAIQAKVEWLVCQEECIPQEAELGIALSVVEPATEIGRSAGQDAALIKTALDNLPVASPWPASWFVAKSQLNLRIQLPANTSVKDAWFYPYDWGRLNQSAAQVFTRDGNALVGAFPVGESPPADGDSLSGILVATLSSAEGDIHKGFILEASPTAAIGVGTGSDISLAYALLLALTGGLILNLMPCVFPVLSLKALSMVQYSGHSTREIRLQGLVYALGILASFTALAGVLIVLKAGGAQVGWGFQFQSPYFVVALAALLFGVGLNLSGVFEVGGAIASVGANLAERRGLVGSFFTGVLATIVATPCTAPFMAVALGYALSQPPVKLFAVFIFLGLGLALPYLVLSHWPRLQRWLPKPGAWMERFKQFLAFPLYAACIWLLWVFAQQVDANGVAIALVGLLLVAFAAWLWNLSQYARAQGHFMGTIAALVVLISAAGSLYRSADIPSEFISAKSKTSDQHWQAYSPERLQALLNEGKPVFVNLTAAWCISCLANEKVALSRAPVIEAFERAGIVYLKGDWTNRDPAITELLQKFGRSGVPLYLLYPANAQAFARQPVQLPQILTPAIVLAAVAETVPLATTQ